jgi:hypothetical protein
LDKTNTFDPHLLLGFILMAMASTPVTPDGVWVRPTLSETDGEDATAVFLPKSVIQHIHLLSDMVDGQLLPHCDNTANNPIALQIDHQTLRLLLTLFQPPYLQKVISEHAPSNNPHQSTMSLEELVSCYSFASAGGDTSPLSLMRSIYPIATDDGGITLGQALQGLEQLDYVGGGVAMHSLCLSILNALDTVPDSVLSAYLADD